MITLCQHSMIQQQQQRQQQFIPHAIIPVLSRMMARPDCNITATPVYIIPTTTAVQEVVCVIRASTPDGRRLLVRWNDVINTYNDTQLLSPRATNTPDLRLKIFFSFYNPFLALFS